MLFEELHTRMPVKYKDLLFVIYKFFVVKQAKGEVKYDH